MRNTFLILVGGILFILAAILVFRNILFPRQPPPPTPANPTPAQPAGF